METDDRTDWSKEFRLPPWIFAIGLFGLLFFTVMLVVTFALPDGAVPPDRAIWLRVTGVSVWGTMLILAIWCLLGYWRERLIVNDGSITVRGILKTTSVELRDVADVNWWSMASIKLRTPDATLSIGLVNYPRDVRLLVVEQIKKHCSNIVEKNWEVFLIHGLRFSAATNESIPPDEIVVIKRSRWAKLFASSVVLVVALGFAIANWLPAPGRQIGGAVVMILFLWGLLHFGTPKTEFVTRKPTADDRIRMRLMAGTYLYSVPGLVLCALLRRFGPWIQWGVLGPYMAIGIGLFLWKFIPLTKRDEKRRLERAQQAMDEWNNRDS